MLILGIESASDQCGCALAGTDGVLAETRLALPRRHAEALAPQMRFVCEQAGVTLGDVDAVAVDHGPGLYTGLRAGLATAKATAAALGIGSVPVASLEALAFGAAVVAQPGETCLSVLDARRGEVFWAWYRIAEAGTTSRVVQLSAPQVGPPADLLPALVSPGDRPSGRTIVVGDGALRFADLLEGANAILAGPELRFPSPGAVALLGRDRAVNGGIVAPEQVDALYLRSPDARPQR